MGFSLQKLQSIAMNNLPMKVVAVVLAFLTYYAIRGAISFEFPYELPIEVRVEKGIAILEQDVRSVQVTFRGSQEDIRKLDPQQMRVIVKPRAGESSGSERVPIGASSVEGVPRGVVPVRISPAGVSLTFDHEAEKQVAVQTPETVGTPLIGSASLDYEPRFVTVRGPRLRLKDRNSLATEPVDVDGRVESFTKKVKVLPPRDTWVSSIEPSEITVHVTIATESAVKEIDNVPVRSYRKVGDTFVLTLDPESVKVVLRGRPDMLKNVTIESVRVFVDCEGLQDVGDYLLPVIVHVPQGSGISAKAEPPEIKIRAAMAMPPAQNE